MFPGTFAATSPKRVAVVLAGTSRQLTYEELNDHSAALARVLHDAGLRRGDTIALLTDNTVEAFEVYWAAMRSGLYLTAVNCHLKPSEVAYIINDCGAKASIASASLSRLALDVLPMIEHSMIRLVFGGSVPGYGSYEAALANAGSRLADQPAGAVMLYSSGTTGLPKGVKMPLPDRQVDEPGDLIQTLLHKKYGLTAEDVYLSPAPIYHAAPLRWGGALQAVGSTIVLTRRFDAEQVLALIDEFQVTVTQMVPTMFVRLLKLPENVRAQYDLSSLRVLVHAAAPCPIDVKHAMIDWLGPKIYEYYSSTEANGMTFIDSHEWLAKPGSVGTSATGPVHICDDHGGVQPTGTIGTIYFERDALPFTYHNQPKKTAEAQHPRHPTWTTVGDLGYLDGDGYLYLTDRKGFTIISGGVNIYPREIEDALTLHPKVFDVAVIGIPDVEMGEQVKAVIVLSEDATPNGAMEAELIDYCRQRVAHFKCPKSIDFVDELPRTPTGKLVKGKLIAAYWRR